MGGPGNNYLEGGQDGQSSLLIGGTGPKAHNIFAIHTHLDPTSVFRRVVANPDVIENHHNGDYIEYLGPQPWLAAK